MAIGIQNSTGTQVAALRSLGTTAAPTGSDALLATHAEDRNGRPLALLDGEKQFAAQTGLPLVVINDGQARLMRGDRAGSVGVATYTPLFHEPFDGTALNVARWVAANSTFAPTVGAAGYSFNPGASVTANASAIITSLYKPLKTQRNPFYRKSRLRYSKTANAQFDLGFGAPATTVAPANGAFWRLAGNVGNGVVTQGGVEIAVTPNVDLTPIDGNFFYTYDVLIDDDEAVFTIHDTSGNLITRTTVAMPNGAFRIFGASRLPLYARLINGAVAPATAPVAILSDDFLGALDADANRAYDDFLGSMALNTAHNPQTGAQLLVYGNSAEPANAALSNTAASYNAFGGKYQFAAPVGAVTDFLLFCATVPDPANLKIKRIRIEAKNIGAIVATSATELEWFCMTNMTGATLVSTTGARIPLGLQTFPIGAAIGATANVIDIDLTALGLQCAPGRNFGIGLRIPGGTATASQVIKGTVTPLGTFE
jgi:hypothetical protein